MTDEQRKWLAEHREYSAVGRSVVSLVGWDKQGYLYPNGRFAADDGNTLFLGREKAVRVGREYPIV